MPVLNRCAPASSLVFCESRKTGDKLSVDRCFPPRSSRRLTARHLLLQLLRASSKRLTTKINAGFLWLRLRRHLRCTELVEVKVLRELQRGTGSDGQIKECVGLDPTPSRVAIVPSQQLFLGIKRSVALIHAIGNTDIKNKLKKDSTLDNFLAETQNLTAKQRAEKRVGNLLRNFI